MPGRVRGARGRRARAVRGARGPHRDGRSSSTGSSASSAGAQAGDLFGEVPIALGTTFPFGFRAAEPSRVMRVEAARLPRDRGRGARGRRRSSARWRASGSAGCRASRPTSRRRARSSSATAGTRPARELRRFLDRNQVTFRWITPETPGRGRAVGRPAAGRGGLAGDPRRRRQDRRPAAAAPGGRAARPRHEAAAAEYDTVIVGAGPGRARGRRVRGVGGAADDRGRARGARRPGRHVVADRELPRLPVGRVRRRAREPRAPAGAPARRRDPRHPVDHPDRRRHPPGAPRRRRRPARADDHPRLRRLVAAPADRGLRPAGRQGHLLRRRAQRGLERARARRPHRRRGQLGRAGGAVLLHLRAERDDPLPRRPAREEHVALPRSTSSRRGRTSTSMFGTEVVGRARRRRRSRRSTSRDSATAETTRLESGGLFIFIGADAETGVAAARDRARPQRLRAHRLRRAPTERWTSSTATPTCSRRASRASSPAATCASAPSSAWPPRSARAAWRSPSCTSTCATSRREPGGVVFCDPFSVL